ncbi:MAG: FKBP-type peptidyl-prolyl cis-trans isomerase [Candidatus Acidiferrales bacterium]
MKNLFTTAVMALAAGIILAGSGMAQQAPASNSQQTPATKTQTAPASKTHPATAAKSANTLTLKTEKDKLSYAIGLNVGKSLQNNIQKDSLDIEPAILARAVKDVLAGGETLLTDDEAKAIITALQTDLRQKQEAKMKELGDANKKEGDEFLAANKAKEGVVTLPSGLQYKILIAGTGPKPTASDTVICNYKGTLLDNTEFDSSYKRGKPATIPVGHVIKGWTEALQLMPVGSKWQLFIPSDLAYGERGAGGTIGPNATLIFEVELISIQEKSSPAPAAQPQPPSH